MSQNHVYQGHRAESFVLKDEDDALMEEWRTRQRTFDGKWSDIILTFLRLICFLHRIQTGAYLRASLACLVYALAILRLFSKKFDKSKSFSSNYTLIQKVLKLTLDILDL